MVLVAAGAIWSMTVVMETMKQTAVR